MFAHIRFSKVNLLTTSYSVLCFYQTQSLFSLCFFKMKILKCIVENKEFYTEVLESEKKE